jgi:hypothetical protein
MITLINFRNGKTNLKIKKMKRLIVFFILAVLLYSCTVYREYAIDIYKPGEVLVPRDARNVVLVYRNFKYPADTLQNYYKRDFRLVKAKSTPQELDSVLVTTCLFEVAKNFKTNLSFGDIKIMPYHSFTRHEGEKIPALDFDVVKRIAETADADLVISLETFSYFFSEFSGNMDSPESNEVITANVWAVFDPKNEKLIERKALIDTVFWNGYDANGNLQRNFQLPPRETALKIASQLAGENYAKRFFATWQTVNRLYSIPPLPDFEKAASYVDKGEWENAIPIWEKYAADDNGKLAINARYNLALASEMNDDLETAVKWANAAQTLAIRYRDRENVKMIMQYRNILDERRKDIIKLNQNK